MTINWQSLLGFNRLRDSARYWAEEGGHAVNDRMELAMLEWQTQKKALLKALIAAMLLGYFGFGLLLLGSMATMLHWWDTEHWGSALAGVLGFWLAAAVVSTVLLLHARKRFAKAFVLTRKVLAADWQEFKEHL